MKKEQATEKVVEKKEVKEHTPTPEEARQMFKENKGLSSMETTEGTKYRYE